METRNYFVLKRLHQGNILYAKGYGNWTHNFNQAKMYTKIANAKKGVASYNSDSTIEILYITISIQDANDILEKEFDLN